MGCQRRNMFHMASASLLLLELLPTLLGRASRSGPSGGGNVSRRVWDTGQALPCVVLHQYMLHGMGLFCSSGHCVACCVAWFSSSRCCTALQWWVLRGVLWLCSCIALCCVALPLWALQHAAWDCERCVLLRCVGLQQ